MQQKPTWPRWIDATLVALFLIAIAAPGIAMLVQPPTRRAKAATGEIHPALHDLLAKDRTALDTARTLRHWFETRFAFRDGLVYADALLKVRLLGISTSDSVIVGSDGWLFYAGEQALDLYRRVRPFSPDELAAWKGILARWVSISQASGARVVMLIAPDKTTVYPDHMPSWTAPVAGPSRLDQLKALVQARGDIDLVDVREVLAAERRRGIPLYYFTDTHWNDLAGYLASRELMRTLGKRFPGVTLPPPPSNISVITLPEGGDLARFLGLKKYMSDVDVLVSPPDPEATIDTFLEGSSFPWRRREDLKRDMRFEPHVESHRPGAPIERAYVVRDSFGNAMIPYLAETFGSAIYHWTEWLDPDEANAYHPDVIIIEIAERYLMEAPKDFMTPPPPKPD